jgi:hypothetical protein
VRTRTRFGSLPVAMPAPFRSFGVATTPTERV